MHGRTIDWMQDALVLIDQTRLPHVEDHVVVRSADELVDAIKRLVVRGAPALGVAGGYGVVLAARTHGPDGAAAADAIRAVRDARPTAVNLARGVDRVAAFRAEGVERMLAEAHAIRDEEIAASHAMGQRGADLLLDLVGRRPIRVMTVCNTGGLATVERGTALAVACTLHERGLLGEVLAVETRPLLQGARLTTWELRRMGAPHRLLVDAAGPFMLARGEADVVITGADRIAANGDTANKIGTFSLALGAQFAGVPFVVVAPETTIDPDTPTGRDIEIEDRGAAEVVEIGGQLLAPAGTVAVNPAFDVTPASLITAIVTDRRVIRPGDLIS